MSTISSCNEISKEDCNLQPTDDLFAYSKNDELEQTDEDEKSMLYSFMKTLKNFKSKYFKPTNSTLEDVERGENVCENVCEKIPTLNIMKFLKTPFEHIINESEIIALFKIVEIVSKIIENETEHEQIFSKAIDFYNFIKNIKESHVFEYRHLNSEFFLNEWIDINKNIEFIVKGKNLKVENNNTTELKMLLTILKVKDFIMVYGTDYLDSERIERYLNFGEINNNKNTYVIILLIFSRVMQIVKFNLDVPEPESWE